MGEGWTPAPYVGRMDESFLSRHSMAKKVPDWIERTSTWTRFSDWFDAMQDAAEVLLGTHDFTTFRAAQCQSKAPVKTLDVIEFSRSGELVEARLSARSFLHNQVRSIVGTLKLVGEGRWTRDEVRKALEARDHQLCGALAPPHGLYLAKVDYDVDFTPLDTTPRPHRRRRPADR